MTAADTILSKSQPEPMSGCWIWRGHVSTQSYARMWHQGREVLAHRVSYEAFVGPIPDGLQLDHKCRTRCCVNPDHLEAVTSRENTVRGVSPIADLARSTHCRRGHELSGENAGKRPGRRECQTCKRARDSLRWPKNRTSEVSRG